MEDTVENALLYTTSYDLHLLLRCLYAAHTSATRARGLLSMGCLTSLLSDDVRLNSKASTCTILSTIVGTPQAAY